MYYCLLTRKPNSLLASLQSCQQEIPTCRSPAQKIPLSPSTNFSVGEKQKHIPPPHTPIHLSVCTTHQLTNHLVTWLIDCYRLVGVRNPNCSRTKTPSVRIHQHKNCRCQNQFIIPLTHQGEWDGRKFVISAWIPSFRRFPFHRLRCTSFSWFFLHVVYTWRVKSSDRKRSVLFPLNIKQSPNLG